MHSTIRTVSRTTTFITGVALGLLILSGPASAAPASPANPSKDTGVFTADGSDFAGEPADATASTAAPTVESAPPAGEATPTVAVDVTDSTTPPAVVVDDPVAPPAVVSDDPVVAIVPGSTEVRPLSVRGLPASPVVALAPGNWGMSARVVGVRKAPRVTTFDSSPATRVLALRISREDTLPRTGVDTGLLTMVAVLLLVAGTVLARQGRAPAATAASPRWSSQHDGCA